MLTSTLPYWDIVSLEFVVLNHFVSWKHCFPRKQSPTVLTFMIFPHPPFHRHFGLARVCVINSGLSIPKVLVLCISYCCGSLCFIIYCKKKLFQWGLRDALTDRWLYLWIITSKKKPMCEDLCMLYTFLLLFLTNYLFSHIQLKK